MAATGPLGMASRIKVDDPHVHQSLASPWEFVIRAQSRAPYGWTVDHVTTPSFVIYRERMASAVRLVGWSPRGMLAFLIPFVTPARSTLWRQPIRDRALSCALNLGVDVSFAAGQRHYMVLVQREFLRRVLTEEQVSLVEACAQSRVLQLSSGDLQSLAGWVREVLTESVRNPEMLRCGESVDALGVELSTRLAALAAAVLPARGTPAPRARVIERAMAYLWESDGPRSTVIEVSRAIGVSQRTLEYAFRQQFDLTPHAFLVQQRLHEARRRLLAADARSSSVSRIAGNLGFWHLSRFAANYHAMFGEYPAATLRKQPSGISPPFHV